MVKRVEILPFLSAEQINRNPDLFGDNDSVFELGSFSGEDTEEETSAPDEDPRFDGLQLL